MQPLECGEAASSSGAYYTPDGQYRIDGSEMGLLGSGAHGMVRLGQHAQTGEYVAVKISPTAVVRSACKEMTALTRLDNPHIVRLLGVQVDMQQEKVYIIMELCQGGELFDRIAECGGLPEEDARRYFVHILSALRHCHKNHVYHRDLKPENILLDGQDNAKVADFGLAAVYQHIEDDARYLQHTKVGSVMYAAPEVLTSTAQTGYDAAAADMWSLGIILFSMLSGTLPFQCAAASRCKRYAAVVQQGIQVMCPETLSPDVTALLARMIHPDPKQRYTPEQALQSAWLTRGGASPSASDLAEDVQGRARIGDPPQPRSWTIVLHLPEQRRLPDISTLVREAPPPAGTSSQSGSGGSAEAELSPSAVGGSLQSFKRKRDDGAPSATPDAAAPLPPRAALLPGDPGAAAAPPGAAGVAPPHPFAAPPAAGAPPCGCAAAASGAGVGGAALGAGGAGAGVGAGAGASGVGGAGSGAVGGGGPLAALPLTGCLTEYVQLWGWEPLPRGTEQLLRDILQTLRALGLQYTLHEERSEPEPPGGALQTASSSALSGGAGSSSDGGAGGAARRPTRLIVKINFTTLDAAGLST